MYLSGLLILTSNQQVDLWQLVYSRQWSNKEMFLSGFFGVLELLGLRLFDKIASNGFWSVSSIKWLAYKKWWNFSIAHATAKDSISIDTYPLCAAVSALLAMYTSFHHATSMYPVPLCLPLCVGLFVLLDCNMQVWELWQSLPSYAWMLHGDLGHSWMALYLQKAL